MNKQESSYRWVVFGTVLFAYYLIVSQRTAPGLITDQLMTEFYVSAAFIGLVSSIQFFAYAGLQIPAGLLSDRYGPNHFLILGTFLAGLGSVLYSLAENEYLLIFSRFLVGMGDATIFINFVLILTEWFVAKEFIKLIGLISLAGSLGSLTATVPFSKWISVSGWRLPFLSTGLILLVLAFILYLVLILNPKRHFNTGSIENKKEERESVWKIFQRVFSTRQAWGTFFCHFGIVGAYIGFIGSWGVPYGIQVFDLSRLEASQLIMFGLVGAMVGGPLSSWISSRYSSIKRLYTFIHMIVFTSWMGLFLSGANPSYMLVVVLFFMIGFGNGSGTLTFAVVRESFSVKEVGVVTGFANTGGFLSAVFLPIIFGKILDFFPSDSLNLGYHYGLLIPVLFSFIGLIGAILLKEKRKEEEILNVS